MSISKVLMYTVNKKPTKDQWLTEFWFALDKHILLLICICQIGKNLISAENIINAATEHSKLMLLFKLRLFNLLIVRDQNT